MMMNNMLMLRGWLSNQQHYYHGAIERARLTRGCLATTRITTALRRGGLLYALLVKYAGGPTS